MKESSKVGYPMVSNRCTHCVMVRSYDLEWDKFVGMMEKADEKVKATFIKRLIFGKPFIVLVTDKSLLAYKAKLSEFFSQFRTVGVNHDLVVKELRGAFSERTAMRYLYNLEKASIEMVRSL